MAEPNTNDQATPTPDGDQPTPSPPASDPEPAQISMPKATFDERLARAQRVGQTEFLKSLGFSSVEEAAEWKKKSEEAAQAVEEARRKEMTEIEKYKADLEAERKRIAEVEERAAQAQAEKESAEVQVMITRACAGLGIKNVAYATHLIEDKLMTLGDDDILDENDFLEEILKDPTQKAALGVVSAQPQGANTSSGDGPAPKPNSSEEPFDAMKASPEDMKKRLEALGVPRI